MSKKILKITMKQRGEKGVVVTFEQPSKRMDMNFRDKHNVTYRAPVNKELTQCMDAFKDHLMNLCNVDKGVAHEDITITDVEAHDGWFKIGGKIRSVGDTEYIQRTPKIQDDGSYDKEKEVAELIGSLYKEVRAYISEKKMADPAQIVMQFAKNDDGFNVEEFDKMSDEEKLVVAREYLEKSGAIVIEQQPEDLALMEGMVDPDEEQQNEGEGAPVVEQEPGLDEAVVPVETPKVVAPRSKGKVVQLQVAESTIESVPEEKFGM
jgi:hypothetical protein